MHQKRVASGLSRLARPTIPPGLSQAFAVVLLGALLSVAAVPARADLHEWTRTGPPGVAGTVNSFAIGEGEDLYVASTEGLFESRDEGMTWRRVAGITSAWTVSSDGSTLYASGERVDPVSGRIVSGLYANRDRGGIWTFIHDSPAYFWMVAGRSPSPLVYGAFDMTLERSDGGRVWKNISPLALQAAAMGFIGAVAVDPLDARRIYYAHEGIIGSHDGGDTWTRLFGEDAYFYTLFSALAAHGAVIQAAIVCSDSKYSYAHVFGCGITTSIDGGLTWSSPQLSAESISALVIDPQRPWRSFAGTATGRVYRSDDFGRAWVLIGEGLGETGVAKLGVSANGKRLYAGTRNGLYVLTVSESSFDRLPHDPQRLPRLIDGLHNRRRQ